MIVLKSPAFAGFPNAATIFNFITLPNAVHFVDHRIMEQSRMEASLKPSSPNPWSKEV